MMSSPCFIKTADISRETLREVFCTILKNMSYFRSLQVFCSILVVSEIFWSNAYITSLVKITLEPLCILPSGQSHFSKKPFFYICAKLRGLHIHFLTQNMMTFSPLKTSNINKPKISFLLYFQV